MIGLQLKDCTKCELRSGCSQVVWGSGSPSPKIMFVGDYPGDEEDLMGEPFMSREGVMLVNLIEKAGIAKSDCFFTYSVKCFPAKSKVKREHLKACAPWLWNEMKTIMPTVLVSMGKETTRQLLGLKSTYKLADYVGTINRVDYMKLIVAPWYSPNHILQHGKKADAETITFLKRVMELVNVGT